MSRRRLLRREGAERMRLVALALVRREALEEPPQTEGDEAYAFAIQCVLDAIDEVVVDEMCADDYQEKV